MFNYVVLLEFSDTGHQIMIIICECKWWDIVIIAKSWIMLMRWLISSSVMWRLPYLSGWVNIIIFLLSTEKIIVYVEKSLNSICTQHNWSKCNVMECNSSNYSQWTIPFITHSISHNNEIHCTIKEQRHTFENDQLRRSG